MKLRRGMTLIEMMVALVLTGIVALLAYGSVQAGLDSAGRIEGYQRKGESQVLLRSLVTDALRHPADAPDGSGTAFEVLQVTGGGEALRFVSRGVSGPLGAGHLWRVEVGPSSQGLAFNAAALDGDVAPVRGIIPSLRSMMVRVLRSSDDGEWQSEWKSTRQFPVAVEIVLRDSLGVVAGAPLVVQLGPGLR